MDLNDYSVMLVVQEKIACGILYALDRLFNCLYTRAVVAILRTAQAHLPYLQIGVA